MNILLITQWYPPVKSAASNRTSKMAYFLKKQGHNVTVLTGMPSYPTGILPKKYHWKLYCKEKIDDIDVLRTYEYPAPNQGVFKRLFNNFTFLISALIAILIIPKYDIVIVSSPPFLGGIAGLLAKQIWGAKFIFDVRDLWPDAAIELGFLHQVWLIKILKFLEMRYYKVADFILTATPSIKKDIIDKGIPENKVITLLNSVDTAVFKPLMSEREPYGFSKNDFVIAYTGNMGAAQGLETTIEAAKLLRKHSNIKFLFVGEGEEKEKLVDMAKGNNNIIFLPEKDREEIIKIINVSNIGNISLAKNKIFQQAIPSKTLEYFACGKPVIAGVSGTLKEIINESDAGVIYDVRNPKDLANKVLALSKKSILIKKMGHNARSLALKTFSNNSFRNTLAEFMDSLS